MIALWFLAALGALHSVISVRAWWEMGPRTAFGCRKCKWESGYARLYVLFLLYAWWHVMRNPSCRPEPGMSFGTLVLRALKSWWRA